MRIPCPFCGERDAREFTYRGDAAPKRPENGTDMFDYVYLRTNAAGVMEELWYHTQGCRRWLVVKRDTTNHTIHAVRMAQEGGQ